MGILITMPILQVATWAGNLMLTHDHDDFPSDVFVVMAAVGATLSIGQSTTEACTIILVHSDLSTVRSC